MTDLSVNLNKVALLRNARGADCPNVLDFAHRSIQSGAHGITVHPRQDQRHATYRDTRELADFCRQQNHAEFNVEGYPSDEFLEVVKSAQPAQCTLVPDAPDQITSDHGWDTRAHGIMLQPIIAELKQSGIRTSLFLDPQPDLIASAAATGTDRIELYTEAYAKCFGTDAQAKTLQTYAATAKRAAQTGLGVNAGHDLNQENLGQFLTISEILEVSIGHAITVEALTDGFEPTVRAYVRIVQQAG